jgi:hypothetical protein
MEWLEWLLELLGLGSLFRRDPSRSPLAAVPNLHGLPVGIASRTLSYCDLCIELVRLTEHPATAEEVVVDQRPAPGERVPYRSTVTIYVQHPPAANSANHVKPRVRRSRRTATD